MQTVVELMRQRADKKVALLAAQHVQDRAYGHPREEPPDQRGRIVLALDSLSTEELEVLERALRKGLIPRRRWPNRSSACAGGCSRHRENHR
jgi:hypothetical protein